VYYFYLDRTQFAHIKLYNIRAVFFNCVSAEPLCSASGYRGSAETDRNCLGRNSQPQFCAVVAI